MAKAGMLPTPTAMDSTNATATMKSTQVKEGSMHSVTLNRALSMGILPTPRVFAYKDSAMDRGKGNLGEVTGAGSQLNPRFVAEMMGFPPNWTELPFQNGETNP
jgi:hypothetical protein